jgi:hypothetical protein
MSLCLKCKILLLSPLAPRAPRPLLLDWGVQPAVAEAGAVAWPALLPSIACARCALAKRHRIRETASKLCGRGEGEVGERPEIHHGGAACASFIACHACLPCLSHGKADKDRSLLHSRSCICEVCCYKQGSCPKAPQRHTRRQWPASFGRCPCMPLQMGGRVSGPTPMQHAACLCRAVHASVPALRPWPLMPPGHPGTGPPSAMAGLMNAESASRCTQRKSANVV